MTAFASGVQSARQLVKQWDWPLFLLIFLYMALPQFYRSYSIYLIGNTIPDTNALATVAQWQFVDLMLEVVQETFVLAIFFFVGRGMQSDQGPASPIRTSLTMILLVSVVLAVTLFILSPHFVAIIGTPEDIRATTSTFLRIKTAGIPIFLLSAACVIIVETVNRKRLILTLAILQVVYRFVLDTLFYGGRSFSLDAGVLGVAWSDTLASLALLMTAIVLIRPLAWEKLKGWRTLFSFRGWNSYLRVGSWSGLDSFVRNVVYFFMIVRLLNLLGENHIGGYYLAMHIFWGFLLVPVLALSESSKVLIANNSANRFRVRSLWYSSLIIGGLFLLIWIIFLPFWRSFAGLLNSNGEVVNLSVTAMAILVVPYILFALNAITDSIFYGVGRTRFQAYQAIITNGTVYVMAFVAYLTGLWEPTFRTILILFGLGILVDSILTVHFAFRVVFQRNVWSKSTARRGLAGDTADA